MVLALGVPSAAQQPRQPDASGVQQPASPQALAPAIAKDAAPYAPRCSAPKDHDEADFCEQRKAYRLNLFSALIGALGFAALIVTIYYTRKATRAAQEAALAAHAAVDETRNTAKTELRAYLSVNPGRMDIQNPEKTMRFGMYPVMRNAGQTPAYKVRFVSEMKLLPVPLPQGFDFTLPDHGGSVVTLAAGETCDIIKLIDHHLDESELGELFTAGGRRLYAWGHVWYEDVWERTHETHFCFHVEFAPDRPIWITDSRNTHAR